MNKARTSREMRAMTMKRMLILGTLLLAACTTNDERCRSYGAVPGTPEYINCMATMAHNQDIENSIAATQAQASMQAQQAASQAQLQQFENWHPR